MKRLRTQVAHACERARNSCQQRHEKIISRRKFNFEKNLKKRTLGHLEHLLCLAQPEPYLVSHQSPSTPCFLFGMNEFSLAMEKDVKLLVCQQSCSCLEITGPKMMQKSDTISRLQYYLHHSIPKNANAMPPLKSAQNQHQILVFLPFLNTVFS